MDRAREGRPIARRIGGITLALFVIGGAVLLVEQKTGTSAGRFTDPKMGWTIEVPSGFAARPFGTTRLSGGGSSGVVIADFHVRDPASLSYLGSFPPRGAALRIWNNDESFVVPVSRDDAHLPLDLDSFHEIDPYVRGSEPTPLYRSFNANGSTLNAAVWLGPDASLTDLLSIRSAIASLSFPPTEPGVLDQRMIVLGPTENFPIGSVTRYDRDDLPRGHGAFDDYRGTFRFYLVRGTSGFYAVTTDFLGNGAKCDLLVEEDPLMFSCPAAGWTWDRLGSTIRNGEPWPDGAIDLLILPAPRSWDGNVMIDPFGNRPEAAAEAWRSSDGRREGDVVSLPRIPAVGMAVGSARAVQLIGLDGSIVATLPGYTLAGNPGAPGVWLQRGSEIFSLSVTRGALVRVADDEARNVMYDEGPQPRLPPPRAFYRSGDVGHWRYAYLSRTGTTLAQWSGECEVPTAYWIDGAGKPRIVTAEHDASTAPESIALGWTLDGEAVVFLPVGYCGGTARPPGVYLFEAPGVGRLVFETGEHAAADMWGLELGMARPSTS